MLGKEFGYAARSLRKSPIFLITAVATIALGIGASTAIFSVTNAVLLRPMPYRDPDRLVLAFGDMRKRHDFDGRVSNENFMDLRNGSKKTFEEFAAVSTGRVNVPREDGTPEQVRFAQVTSNFFQMMGAKIAEGRDFNETDAQPQPPPDPTADPNQPSIPPLPNDVILSYEYWQRRFGGNRDVIGRPIFSQGAPFRPVVVGVLAPGFELLYRPSLNEEVTPDMWIASRAPYDNRNRNSYFWRAIGRLRQGATIAQAHDETELVSAEIRRNFPVYAGGDFDYRLEPMHAHMVAEVRPAILALLGAGIFLLLIACANVANLLLVRSSLRERELAVRVALGGSRSRLIGQMLAEALLLAVCGTACGIVLAEAGIRALIALSPANLPRLDAIRLDVPVVAFAFAIGLLAAAVFGIVPAWRASRPDVMKTLRGSSRTAGLGAAAPRNAVVVVEVALSFVLLIGSGLMVRSFLALQHVKLGYDSHDVLTFQVLGGRPATQPAQRAAYIRELRDKLQTIPGVESVSASGLVPLGGGYSTIRWGKEDALADSSKYQAVDSQFIIPGFFETMRTPLLDGRTFTDADNAPDRNVVVVDQVLAAKAFPNQSAIGKRILIRVRTPEPEWVEIIGVVAHEMTTSLIDAGREQIYFTDGFVGHGRMARWELRTSGDPAQYAPQVRSAIAPLDPHLAIFEVQTMDALVEKAQAGTRFSLLLIAAFAVIAALLAAVGLYGVLSTVVRQRTAEIGVRMALGAEPAKIFKLVVGHGLALSAFGVVVGIIAALGLTRAMSSMLVAIQPTDPVTFLSITVLFFAIAVAASWIPAFRASNLDPTVALRQE
jgi:predicted permease